MIQIRKFTFNPVQENTYLLYDETGECIIVDPGCYFQYEREQLDDFIVKNKLKPISILCTHCHFDHIMGVEWIRNNFKIPFLAHLEEQFLVDAYIETCDKYGIPAEPINAPDKYINEGDIIEFGNSKLHLIHVPGHTPGSLVIYNSEQSFIISGDVLFQGSIGRTDLPKGNFTQLVEGIKSKLMILPEETISYCGHGGETTIKSEKTNNHFLT